MLWIFFELGLVHKFNGYDSVLVQSVPLVDSPIVTLTQSIGLVHKEVVVDLCHPLHF